MKQKIIITVFFLIEALCSFLAWQSVYQAVFVSESSRFLVPGIFFSLAAVFLLTSSLLFSSALFRMIAVMIAVLPALFFGWSILACIAVGFALLFLYRSLSVVRQDLSEHLTVRFFSSARMGTFLMSLGFSLAIAASYASMIAQFPGERLLPRFSLAEGPGRAILQIAGKANKSLVPLVKDNPSIDEFLSGLMPEGMATGSGEGNLSAENISSEDAALRDALKSFGESNGIDYEWLTEMSGETNEEFQKKLFLEEGRRRMSDALGRSVQGDERATDVLSEIINAKIFGTFSAAHNAEGKSLDILRAVIVILLFLSLFSLGSAFGFVWAFLSWIVFWILQRSGIVVIRRTPVEAERAMLSE